MYQRCSVSESMTDDIEEPVEKIHQFLILLTAVEELLSVEFSIIVHIDLREDPLSSCQGIVCRPSVDGLQHAVDGLK